MAKSAVSTLGPLALLSARKKGNFDLIDLWRSGDATRLPGEEAPKLNVFERGVLGTEESRPSRDGRDSRVLSAAIVRRFVALLTAALFPTPSTSLSVSLIVRRGAEVFACPTPQCFSGELMIGERPFPARALSSKRDFMCRSRGPMFSSCVLSLRSSFFRLALTSSSLDERFDELLERPRDIQPSRLPRSGLSSL